ncbi:MAG: hypothetical protein V4736_02155 [Bdellovibrionota bacterium]
MRSLILLAILTASSYSHALQLSCIALNGSVTNAEIAADGKLSDVTTSLGGKGLKSNGATGHAILGQKVRLVGTMPDRFESVGGPYLSHASILDRNGNILGFISKSFRDETTYNYTDGLGNSTAQCLIYPSVK